MEQVSAFAQRAPGKAALLPSLPRVPPLKGAALREGYPVHAHELVLSFKAGGPRSPESSGTRDRKKLNEERLKNARINYPINFVALACISLAY